PAERLARGAARDAVLRLHPFDADRAPHPQAEPIYLFSVLKGGYVAFSAVAADRSACSGAAHFRTTAARRSATRSARCFPALGGSGFGADGEDLMRRLYLRDCQPGDIAEDVFMVSGK